MISLLHPSRSRVAGSQDTTVKWLSRAGTDIELIISLDSDDPQLAAYLEIYGDCPNVIVNDNRSAVDAINAAAKVSTGDILIVLSDDTDCPMHWDKTILAAVDGYEDYVLRVSDRIQKWICTMPIMDRVYYNRFGYIYHPDFRHMFCDTWFTHQADVLKRIIWRDDIEFPHLHYSVRRGSKDDVNVRNDSTTAQGRDTYISLVRQGIEGVDIHDLDHRAVASGHVEWMNKHRI